VPNQCCHDGDEKRAVVSTTSGSCGVHNNAKIASVAITAMTKPPATNDGDRLIWPAVGRDDR
ncbi:MAG: hypothetical protein RLZZ332_1548, partial [Actinomycetota bacterium]